MITPGGLARVPTFLTMAETVIGLTLGGVVGPTEVTVKSMPTLNGTENLLLLRLTSLKRFTSSTHAWIVWAPEVALHVPMPEGPLLAVTVTLAPGASDWVSVSDQLTSVPSTSNCTPTITPAGVATVPTFCTVAENVTAVPLVGFAGVQLTLVTVRSMPTLRVTERLLLVLSLSALRFAASTQARTVWAPDMAVHLLLPDAPLLASTVPRA